MNATDSKALCEYVHARWPDNTTSEDLWRDFRDRLLKHPPMPLDRAKEIVGEVRWNTKAYRSPDLPAIEKALGLAARQCAAGVSRQNAEFSANRRQAEPVENVESEHHAAREFVRNLSQPDLIRLRDRCLSRESMFVRMLVSDRTPDGIKPDPDAKAIDWSDRESVLSRLWVCMGLHMEHSGFNGWSPIRTAEEVTP